MKLVVIGGVTGGASTAARVRRLDASAEIIMFERMYRFQTVRFRIIVAE